MQYKIQNQMYGWGFDWIMKTLCTLPHPAYIVLILSLTSLQVLMEVLSDP